MNIKLLKLDDGIYKDAKTLGISVSSMIAALEAKEGVNYSGTQLNEFDAFQRQMIARGLATETGKLSSVVQDFFQTSDNTVLFPEWINRAVIYGMSRITELYATLADVVSLTTTIDGNAYRPSQIDWDNTPPLNNRRVPEFGKIPTVTISLKDKAINLYKYASGIKSSYETLRRQTIDRVALVLNEIGFQAAQDMIELAVYTLLNGDGNPDTGANSYTIGTSPIGGVAGTWSYTALVDFNSKLTKKWSYGTILGNEATIDALLKISEFNLVGGLAQPYQSTGVLPKLFGKQVFLSDAVGDNKLLYLDKQFGVELIKEAGAQLVEASTVMNQQFKEIDISDSYGCAILERSAKVLNKG